MNSLEHQLKALAQREGATLIGLTTKKRLQPAPPSADPSYLLPSARGVVAFAVSLDQDAADAFLGKACWESHCEDRKKVAQQLYRLGDSLVALLRGLGHEAINVEINNNYRPEKNAKDVTEMTEFHPSFSHRYAALAAGLGRLGWSGNLLTRDHGALVELGSVLTSAELRPDAPLPDTEHPCDDCKMCALVCPVEMIARQEAIKVVVAGVEERIAQKRPNTCCWIGCSGYHGLAPSGRWSNFSPYRLQAPLPRDKNELNALCRKLQKEDPQMQETNSLGNYRQAVFDPHWVYHTVCGYCRSVCVPTRKARVARQKRIRGSGLTALDPQGRHVAAPQEAKLLETPFTVDVLVTDPKGFRKTKEPPQPELFPLDREVVAALRNPLQNNKEKK